MDTVARQILKPVSVPLTDIDPTQRLPLYRGFDRSSFQQHEYENAVRKCKEYIKAGDIFQVVLSQRLETETRADPFDIYRTLRVVNPSPFMFYLKSGPIALVGASPEIMVRVEGDKVTIRPLAGTRRRGKTEEEDAKLAAELIADPKERAEHIMLVDLGRNDVGRVIAAQVHQHDVLGPLLRVGDQLGGQFRVFLLRLAAPARPGQRPNRHLVPFDAHHDLRRRAHQRDRARLQVKHEWTRVHDPQRPVDVERVGPGFRLQPLAEHDLEDVAGLDVFLALPH